MAAKRGRNRQEFGSFFGFYSAGGLAPVGQPVMVRMQGVPTMPGYRDRIGKWNALLPPIFALALKAISDRLSDLFG